MKMCYPDSQFCTPEIEVGVGPNLYPMGKRGLRSGHAAGLGRHCTCIRIFSVILIFLNSAAETGVAASTDCGYSISDPSGSIKSPNYPETYPPDTACKWHIRLTGNLIATLSFVDLDISDQVNCGSERLDITPKSKEYCGSTLPQPFISEVGRTVTITFIGSHSPTHRGFHIDYYIGESDVATCVVGEFHCSRGNCIPRKWMCNGKYECADGDDESRDICHQAVTTQAPRQCQEHHFLCRLIDSHKFDCLSETKKCDGHVDCADRTDEDGCSSVCEYFLKGTHGHFQSPNFPKKIDNNLECVWHLSVAEGDIINLRFEVFDLEVTYNTDFVTVYDGDSTETEKGTYYGYMEDGKQSIYMPPAVIEGSGNQLRVYLRTDSTSPSNGFNATFQTKGICIGNQKRCSPLDSYCYDAKEVCDNRMACIRGEDEQGCSDSCHQDQILCFDSSTKGCFSLEERCDGKKDCQNREDEENCDRSICNYNAGLFLCKSGKCIQEKLTCDSSFDCSHGEDEDNCPISINIVTAAAVGSIVCGMLLVAALSCTCKLYQLHVRERLPPSHMSPLREIEEELLRREAPPSYTATMASPHFDEAQRAFIEGIQAAVIARNESRSSSRSGDSGSRRQRGTFVRMLSRDRNVANVTSPPIEQDESTTETQSETLPPSPTNGRDNDSEATTTLEEGNNDENPQPPLLPVSGERSPPVVLPSPVEAYPPSTGCHQAESSSQSDTDSETNQDAMQLAARDQQILRAAANIRRMRLVGGLQNVMQAQDHRAARARSRTGSLIDQTATNSSPEDNQEETPASEGGPDSAAAVRPPSEHTTDSTGRTETIDRAPSPEAEQALGDDTPPSSQGSPSHQDPAVQPHECCPPQQAEGRAFPSPQVDRSPSPPAAYERNESELEEADADINPDRLSQASSMLSLVSSVSQTSAEDAPMLDPQ